MEIPIQLTPEQAGTIQLAWSRERGFHVIAARHLAPGDLVLADQARAVALHPEWRMRLCHGCLQEMEDLEECPACRQVRYCSSRCRERHRGTHARECELLNDLLRHRGAEEARVWLVLRLILGGLLPWESVPLEHLLSHRDRFPEHTLRTCARQAEALRAVLPPEIEISPGEIVELLCKVRVNAFGIGRDGVDGRGLALNRLAHYVNHSCAPNCCYFQEDARMSIRAIETIQPGEELTHNYTFLHRSRRARRAHLRVNHQFTCRCRRCESPHPDLLAAFQCTRGDCGGLLQPQPEVRRHRCQRCHLEQESGPLIQVEAELRTCLREGSWYPTGHAARLRARGRLEELLQRGACLHSQHQLRHVIHGHLAHLCSALGEHEAAVRWARLAVEERLRAVPRYHSIQCQPLRALADTLWRQAMDPGCDPIVQQEALRDCFLSLSQCYLVRSISCGPDHPEARATLELLRRVHDARLLRHLTPLGRSSSDSSR